MNEHIKTVLKTDCFKSVGDVSGGCISSAEVFLTDNGKVFAKKNSKAEAYSMFKGEYESLLTIQKTKIIKVPTPYVVVDNVEGESALVMEYLHLSRLRAMAQLGTKLAQLHLHNIEKGKHEAQQSKRVGSIESDYVAQFGFHVNTSCGYISQKNDWCCNWVDFYSRKLQDYVSRVEREFGDRELTGLWSKLQLIIPKFFKDIVVLPSLLHGDLWSGNAGQVGNEPVVYDASSFYGHHEYDLGIAGLFGGFSKAFWDAYLSIIPKDVGWQQRHELYILFHNINHWCQFGSGYRESTLGMMRRLCK